MLTPYYGTANLTFDQSLSTLLLQYKSTLLYKDRFDVKTSGLDALGVRPAEFGFPLLAIADPEMPIPNDTYSHLSMDNEGLALNPDGTYVTFNHSPPPLFTTSIASGSVTSMGHTYIASIPPATSCRRCNPTRPYYLSSMAA